MNVYRGPDGRQRVWYQADEIELIMEDELRKAGLYPSPGVPAVDVERLVERHLRLRLDRHAALDDDVLGVTEFFPAGRPAISINRDLTASSVDLDDGRPGLVGKWRATLAHEASHVLLHRILYDRDPNQGELFSLEDVAEDSSVRCLKRNVVFGGGGYDWREVQANRGMAALLMPASTVREVLAAEVAEAGPGSADLADAASRRGAQLVARLARSFEVSRQACEIRLSSLGYLTAAGSLLPG